MLIDQFVDETNQAYQHSGVIQRVNLVHAQEIEHTEGTRFQDAELERRDEVLALRDVYAADVVHFVIKTPNHYCGTANVMSYLSPDFESRAFGYTDYRCGGITFAHELGHNMGLNHDRYSERSYLSNQPYPYSYGYVNQRMFERNAPESSRWMTVMSYSDQCSDAGISCMRLLRFSNPDMAYGGDPMGVSGDAASMEVAGPSDARRTLNETRTTVANFRRSSDRTDRCSYVTTPGRQFVEWGGGRFSIAVTTRPGCPWTATSNAEFVTVTHGGSGAGPGMVEYRVASNTGSPRVGMLTVAGKSFGVEQVGPLNKGVCDRTPLVRDALVDALASVNYCWAVTTSDLSGIRRLQLAGQGAQRLLELRAADFSGLTGLTQLSVVNHNLTNLPANLFAGLTALRRLWLVDNGMLTTLPPGLFSDLANLERLYLYGNALTDLPADAFAGLSGVEQLDLHSNRLETLPADVFDGLSGLKDLGLEDNNLKTLPAGIFSDLPGVEVLRLQRNEFAALPAGIFAGLYRLQGFFLTGNPGSPFSLTLELAPADGGVVVGLAEGAPFDVAVGLSVTGGTLSANVARLSTGQLFSDAVSVIPHENAAATIVSLGPPPPIPVGTCTRIVPCYSGVRMELGGPLTLARRNRTPEAVGTLGPVTIKVGEPAVIVEVGGAFRDPDGDALSYTASSSASQVATARAVGARVTVTGAGEGTAAIVVTARDPGGLSATQSFSVTVERRNEPPVAVGALPDRRLSVDGRLDVEVSGAFEDPDGDALSYTASSSASQVATARAVGARVTVSGAGEGTAAIVVTGRDPGGLSATQSFSVTVERANEPPESVGTLSDVRLPNVRATLDVDVSQVFNDPDGDTLTYLASSSALHVVTARVAGSRVTLTAAGVGRATIEVTATDPDGLSAAQSFDVRVTAPFTDDPIQPGVTPIRAVHFTELRTRVDLLREEAGLDRFRWTDAVLSAGVTRVRLVHLLELREALSAAYAAAGRSAPRWTDAAPAGAAIAIRAVHVTELRAAMVALERRP